MGMTYEAYLDEVTTLITEMFDVSEEAAIKHVMRAQAADYFTLHDDLPAMRTQERAVQDAKAIYQQMQQAQQARKPAPQKQAKPAKQAVKRKK
jgi:hypothetical protein